MALRAMAVRNARERVFAAPMVVMATRTLLVSVRILHARMVGGAGMALRAGEVVPARIRIEDRERIGKEFTGGVRFVAGFAVRVEGRVGVGEFAVRMGGFSPRWECELDRQPAEGEPQGRERDAVLPPAQRIRPVEVPSIPGEPVHEIATG